MNTNEIEAAAGFLRRYSTYLGSRDCNDFDLALMIPNKYERRQFVKDCHEWNGDPEEFDPEDLSLPDYAVVGFLAHKLREIAKSSADMEKDDDMTIEQMCSAIRFHTTRIGISTRKLKEKFLRLKANHELKKDTEHAKLPKTPDPTGEK
jgi:hypothetical protein